MKRIATVGLIGVLVLVLSGCSVDFARNDDGSLTATGVISGDSLAREVELALAERDTQIVGSDVTLQNGYMDIVLERARDDDSGTVDTISFKMELGVEDGKLTATVSDVQVNGEAANEERVEKWAERITKRLANQQAGNDRRTLEAVTVTPDSVEMVWHLETWRSQND